MPSNINAPQISVVLTTYNRSKCLARAINSILNQTLTNFELVIINDGSTDDTRKVLADYAKKDERIKVYHQRNSGLAQARNAGVRQAKGAYIAFMDDDDYSLPKRLEEQLYFLQRHAQFAACICHYQHVRKINDKIANKSSCEPRNEDMVYNKERLKNIPVIIYPLSPITMITKEAFQSCGGYRPFFKITEDLDFTLRFQEKFRFGVVPKLLYEYTTPSNNWGGNMTTAGPTQMLKYQLVCYISAWYRRNQHKDPIDQGADLDKVIHMGTQLPRPARFQILYRCLEYPIGVFLSNPNLAAADLLELFRILRRFDDEGDLRFLYHRRKRLFSIFTKRNKIPDALRLVGYALRRSILAS